MLILSKFIISVLCRLRWQVTFILHAIIIYVS